jgi:hypothetical protein
MDSQHRHELQQNDLALLLQKLNRFLEKHGNRISIGICLATILLVGWILWQRNVKAREQVAWSQLSGSSSPDDLADVWKKNPDSNAAPWARLVEAEQRLTNGIQSMFLDVEAGRKDLDQARKSFEVLAEQGSAPRMVRERALFGLARAEESLSDGGTQEAQKAYQRLVERFPDSFFKDKAEQRLRELASGGSAEFYQWFAKFDRPKPKDQSPRDSGTIGTDPGLDTLRDLAEQVRKTSESDESASEETDGLSVPDEDKTPDDKTPDGETPAKDTPAEPAAETPATEPPATEAPADPAVTPPQESTAEPAGDKTL